MRLGRFRKMIAGLVAALAAGTLFQVIETPGGTVLQIPVSGGVAEILATALAVAAAVYGFANDDPDKAA